ncbi:MAG: poly(ADP-ribose) glycohydrolase [Dehalococcoidia bacterium]|nr:poly(ADP-ribose) glycohydrolase [Dehalococcoidia bacterium]
MTPELVRDHPPRRRDKNKRLVYEIIRPAGAGHKGLLSYSRWPTLELPVHVDIGAALERVIERPGFYDYEPLPDLNAVEWHVNFADAHLFVAYSSSLLAQDELQALEHPVLGSVREALSALGERALTVESGKPTPILLAGVERRGYFATEPNADEGRPNGLYGNQFARASADAIRQATHRLEPPTVSNIIAMEAPPGGAGAYGSTIIRYILATAYTGFEAAVQESQRLKSDGSPVVVHTGFWGCGAYGGNRTLMAALQIIAAGLAGLDCLAFHTGEHSGGAFLHQAQALCREELGATQAIRTADIVTRLAALSALKPEYRWGEGNGT